VELDVPAFHVEELYSAMESSLEETFKALQQQAEHLERCLNNQNPEDEARVYLQELANARGKSLEQLKDDVALFSQKIHKVRELSVQVKKSFNSIIPFKSSSTY
jgi:exonuclease VII large subunit